MLRVVSGVVDQCRIGRARPAERFLALAGFAAALICRRRLAPQT
ncbi:hypothetical protein [Streptomyces sp. NPDC057686]